MSITIEKEVITKVKKRLFVPKNFMRAITISCAGAGTNCGGVSCDGCLLGGDKHRNLKDAIEHMNK